MYSHFINIPAMKWEFHAETNLFIPMDAAFTTTKETQNLVVEQVISMAFCSCNPYKILFSG